MKVKRFFAVSAIILVLAGGVFAANTIRRVKTTGLNTNNGTNWALSYKTLQAAMAVSDSTDTIWVAAGVYYDTVRIKNGVCMYGGFAGNESALSERNFRKYQTILDGGDSITPVKINTSAKAVVFNGFVVTRGLSKLGFAKGGAIFISSLAEPTIMNCLFLSNNANSGNGGAIYCSDYSKPSIANCNFIGNVGQLGGAIYSDTASLPLIVSNLFTQNRASRYGGAVMIYKASSSLITIMNNTFAYNSSSKGGAIYTFAAAASSRIANNIFLNNPTGVYCSLVIPSTRTNMMNL